MSAEKQRNSRSLRLMAVHAHPDDESMSTGGTLARYASEGVEVVLVCATKGEEGDILNPAVEPDEISDDIVQMRMKELDEACKILGIHRKYFLGYRDSGMDGSPSNAHPQALQNADIHEATERLVRIIRETKPQVVITYNEKGFYGHPDHIAVNRISQAAVEAASDPNRYPQIQWPPWQPLKFYYTGVPKSRLLKFKEYLEARGEEVWFDVDFLGTPDGEITTRIDVLPFLDRKLRAISSHRSQIGPNSFVSRLPEDLRKEGFGNECYVCVQGCPAGADLEEDLFHGLRD
jgi:mycothiol conjugate amidase Mca